MLSVLDLQAHTATTSNASWDVESLCFVELRLQGLGYIIPDSNTGPKKPGLPKPRPKSDSNSESRTYCVTYWWWTKGQREENSEFL